MGEPGGSGVFDEAEGELQGSQRRQKWERRMARDLALGERGIPGKAGHELTWVPATGGGVAFERMRARLVCSG